ncbi:synaptobrevin family protein, putative [Ichthyophthirius multifiliis]|uniref:Synaptobrevin family protein, putative n=1 Tax=Ichthyophthirius multifiliis TaxID=5932 RepID=G0QYQ1_ICHMU|nr:synaptobrevin family protein, putative [Ichthyophthirius multifiliis]EGR29655.1 synaptobrevin family protein, putative [Ichthyophthirius multifiliis]|eukprot:XP_004030891.1 synaptobrevin family protein, putative [Ichthyophthirius multifiliis]
MISELRKHFEELGDYSEEQDLGLRYHGKKKAESLIIQYNNMGDKDKIGQIQNKLAETKIELQQGINRAIENGNNLEQTKAKTEELSMKSNQLKNQSKELESIMKWRNYKLKIIFGCIILGVGLYILVPIIENA